MLALSYSTWEVYPNMNWGEETYNFSVFFKGVLGDKYLVLSIWGSKQWQLSPLTPKEQWGAAEVNNGKNNKTFYSYCKCAGKLLPFPFHQHYRSFPLSSLKSQKVPKKIRSVEINSGLKRDPNFLNVRAQWLCLFIVFIFHWEGFVHLLLQMFWCSAN